MSPIDSDLKLWFEHGGQQHGPIVEHLSLPLARFPEFVAAIRGATPATERREQCPFGFERGVEAFDGDWVMWESNGVKKVGRLGLGGDRDPVSRRNWWLSPQPTGALEWVVDVAEWGYIELCEK